jgi:hypothetical protein
VSHRNGESGGVVRLPPATRVEKIESIRPGLLKLVVVVVLLAPSRMWGRGEAGLLDLNSSRLPLYRSK